MAYVTTGRRYDQGTVFAVELNVAIKKYASEETYQGTRITYRDKDGTLQEAKMAQKWLDVSPHQNALKSKIATLNSGDEITIYKEKSAPESAVAGKTAEEQKEVGNWGVKRIYSGFVIPEEIQASNPAAASQPVKEPYDVKGVEVGHAINGAYRLLTAAKAKNPLEVIETAKKVHDITVKLKGEYQISTGLSKGKAGAASGHAVLNACGIAKSIEEVEALANSILKDVTAPITDYVNGKTTKTETVKTDVPTETAFI